MADLKAQQKRAFLQSLYDAIVNDTATIDLSSGIETNEPPIITFIDALQAFQRLGFNALKFGKLSMGTSGLGHEVRWCPPQQWRAFSQEEVFALAQEFREVYADALVTLAEAGNSSPNDATILATMFADDRMQTVTSLQHDFSLLRWNQRY
jgi:hypothetical protein